MDARTYTPKIKRAEVDLLPLLPGLADRLKKLVDVPELKTRHARLSEDGNWSVDEDIEGFLWYPGGPCQTCFWEVVRTSDDGEDNYNRTVEYYQMEYFHIIPFLIEYREKWSEEGRMWIIADANNIQLEEWLLESGYLDTSEGIIKKIKENGQAVRNKHHDDMERGQGATDD